MPETTQFGDFDENSTDGALQANTILLARYRIEGQLGGGGQGAVYQARDLNFPDAKRLVAIKEMLVTTADPSQRAATLKTFQREANILATLTHPAIPKIYDFFNQNERAYLVMEYINGRDLEAILVKTNKLPMKRIMEWAIDLCDVLSYLHSYTPEPIIFRDMKPANIMIDSLGKVRLIDFGIAKIFVSGQKQTMIGTEGYSAPEQYKGNANPLSDIYSLGATLHHVITRTDPRLEPPFSFSERPITQLNPDVPPQLAEVINKALEFEPEKRWQSCSEMKEALEEVRYGGGSKTQMYRANNPIANGATAPPASDAAPAEPGTEFFGEDAGSGIHPVWTFEAEDEIRGNAVTFGDKVFVGSYDTNLYALSIEKGEMLWNRATDGGVASSPLIDVEHKQVLFGSEDYTYNAVDMRDGRLNWSYTTRDKIRSAGTLAHGYVFFGSDDGKLYAIIAANGRYMWEYDSAAPIRSKPFVTNDRIIFGNEGGEIIGLELSGQKKWSLRTRRPIMSSPIVDDEGLCYVGGFDGFLYAIDIQNGYSQWRFRTNGPIISSPILQNEFVYFGSADGKVYCVNIQTGKARWSLELGAGIVSSPVMHQETLYIGCTDKKLYAIDARTGKEFWSFQTEGEITATPHITDNLIIIGALDHKLYALPLIAN